MTARSSSANGASDAYTAVAATAETFLPPFANAENRALDAAIVQQTKALHLVSQEKAECDERTEIMEAHLKNVEAELAAASRRSAAKSAQIATEEHLLQLSQRAEGKAVGELKGSLAFTEKECKAQLHAVKSQILSCQEVLERFKVRMNWSSDELAQWVAKAQRKDDDAAALRTYHKEDVARIKSLMLQVEKAAAELGSKQYGLRMEVTETRAVQIELEKAAADFRACHEERREVLEQWEGALATISRRDEEIKNASEKFASGAKNLREKRSEMETKASFLDTEISNNRELEGRIAVSERGLAQLRSKLTEANERHFQAADQVAIIKNTLGKTRTEVTSLRSRNEEYASEAAKKMQQVENLSKKRKGLEVQFNNQSESLGSAEAKMAALTELHVAEKSRLESAERDVQNAKATAVRAADELSSLRSIERDVGAEIAGAQSQSKNLASNLKKVDAEMRKQEELLYRGDYEIQVLQRKVARAGGERSDEEKAILNDEIETLTKNLAAKTEEYNILAGQVKRTTEDLKAVQRRHRKAMVIHESLQEKLSEIELECSTTEIANKQALQEKEGAMVSRDLLKLEASRLREALHLRADEVLDLQTRKANLQAATMARRQELENEKDMLRAQLKAIQEDIHRITVNLKDCETRVEKLHSKYDVLVAKGQEAVSLESDNDCGNSGDEKRTQTYYIIKAAQVRESLQREGNELNAKIKKAEEDVAALEKTLESVNVHNGAFRTSLRKATVQVERQSGVDLEHQQKSLREKLGAAVTGRNGKLAEETAIIEQVQDSRSRVEILEADATATTVRLADLKGRLRLAKKTEEADEEKVNRAQRKVNRLLREAGAEGDQQPDFLQDIELRVRRECNREALAHIHRITDRADAAMDPVLGIN